MVRVNTISVVVFRDLGFKSKEQAINAYRGIRSVSNETEDEYLKRTWHLVKHVVYQNQIDNIIKEEEIMRSKINKGEAVSSNRCLKTLAIKVASTRNTNIDIDQVKYDDLLRKYNELRDIVIELKNENAVLTKAYSSCALSLLNSKKV